MNSFDLFGNPTSPHPLPETDPGSQVTYAPTIASLGEELQDTTPSPRRFWALLGGLALTVTVLGFQAYHLQVSTAGANRALAEGNSVRLLTVAADRGLITDVNGEILAQNSRKLALAINPQTLPNRRAERELVYSILQAKAGLSAEDVASIEAFREKTPDPFAVKTNLTRDESLLYREWFAAVPGVVLLELPVRKYTELASLGQLLGYVGRADQAAVDTGTPPSARIGRAGLERQYNELLSGTPGIQHAEVNATGETVRLVPDSANSQPTPGSTLKLSLDSKLQAAVAKALTSELERRTLKFGPLPKLGASAVVLDPRSGAVRAMVSLPDYSASLFAEGIAPEEYASLLKHEGNPLLNRAAQGAYAPGSTIKPVVASAGLQAGVIGPNTQMNTPDAIHIGQFRFPDWKLHGQTNTRKAIAESNNIFFYAVGGGWEERNFRGLGVDRLSEYYARFGLGKKTGIDLPGEGEGLVPTPTWKKEKIGEPWYIGDTYQASIGQGFLLTTPLQMATAISAVANGGTLWPPRLAWATVDPATGTETELPRTPTATGIIDGSHLQVVREGMRQTVESGSARPLNTLKVKSAGKTGTAQFGSQGLFNAWYVGFAPYENPTIAFAIIIEGGGESFYSSVPVAEEILRAAFNEPLAEGQQLTAHTNTPTEFTGER